MTAIVATQVSAGSDRFQTLIGRHTAFWTRAASSPPLFVTSVSARMAPVPFLLRQSDGSAIRDAEQLTPDMFDVTAMVDEVVNWAPAWEDGALRVQGQWLLRAGVGDGMPISYAPAKMPWIEAMLGCPIALVDGEPWIRRYPGDPEEVIRRGANFEASPWFQLYLEFLRQLGARVGDRFPLTANTLIRGPGDLVSAIMGVQETCLAWIEQPQLMARLLRVCVDAVLHMIEGGYKVLQPFAGGYPCIYALQSPGQVVSTQDDHANLISPRRYQAQILPYTREIIESCPFSVVHLHSGGLHIAPLLLEILSLSAIEVGIDSPPVEGRRPYEVQMLQQILEHKALILDIAPPNVETLEDYEGLLAQLPQRGLCVRVGFEAPVYEALPAGFPGREIWLLR